MERLVEALRITDKKKASVARALDVSRTTVTDWTTNPTKSPSPERVEELADFLGTTPSWLYGKTTDGEPISKKMTPRERRQEISDFERAAHAILIEKYIDLADGWEAPLETPHGRSMRLDYAGSQLFMEIMHISAEGIGRAANHTSSAKNRLWDLAVQREMDRKRRINRTYCLMIRLIPLHSNNWEDIIDARTEVSFTASLDKIVKRVEKSIDSIRSEAILMGLKVELCSYPEELADFIGANGAKSTPTTLDVVEGILPF